MTNTIGGPSTIQPICEKSSIGLYGDGHEVQVLRIGERIGEQRVAVRRGARHEGRADRAGAAGLVLDHDVLADLLLQHRGKHTRRYVGQSARRETARRC